jgi:D-3-phosphoglycerate dehydrogenase
MKKVLFIDTVHPYLNEQLTLKGIAWDYFENLDRETAKKILPQYSGLVVRSKFKLDKEILQHAQDLKFIARAGAGMENIDVEYAESLGIACLNAPEGNRDAVGEHAIGMLLMLFNNLNRADKEVRSGIWKREENRGEELMGKTVALYGYGNTGKAMADKLQGFGCKILVYDKYKKNFGSKNVVESTPEQIFEQADVLSLHLPLTDETKFIFNQEFIQKFQKPFFLINTARGKNVNTEDLAEALKTGKVKGACLDVLEYESVSFENIDKSQLPPAFDYLINAENVVLSPHIAGWTFESHFKISKFLFEKIMEVLEK